MSSEAINIPPESVIRDMTIIILADSLQMDIEKVPHTPFLLDFYDSIDIAWQFERRLKRTLIDADLLRPSLDGASSVNDVVSIVQSHIMLVVPD